MIRAGCSSEELDIRKPELSYSSSVTALWNFFHIIVAGAKCISTCWSVWETAAASTVKWSIWGSEVYELLDVQGDRDYFRELTSL